MQYGKSQGAIDRLTAEQRRVTQEAGTERPFTGEYNDHTEAGIDVASKFIGLRPCQHAESDISGPEQFDPLFSGDNLAARREDGRHINQILLFNIRIAQSELECRESIAMDAYALSQEHASGAREHVSPRFLLARRIAVAMRRC